MSQRELLVSGDFESFPLSDVLATLGLTRQLVELIFIDDQGARASLLVKAGRILHAYDARTKATGAQAFAQMVRAPGQRFQVVRRRTAPPSNEPLGLLGDWIATANKLTTQHQPPEHTPGPEAGKKTLVSGELAQFPLPDLFSVISMTRQWVVLELFDRHGLRGSLSVKGGMLLSVQHVKGASGLLALRTLLEDPGERFVASQQTGSLPASEPLGPLAEMLQQATARPAPAERVLVEGDLLEFGLDDVFSVISISRHCLRLELTPAQGSQTKIWIKASQVLGAERGLESDPVQVLAGLLADPHGSFVVVQQPPPEQIASLGSLGELLREAKDLLDQGLTIVNLSQARAPTPPPEAQHHPPPRSSPQPPQPPRAQETAPHKGPTAEAPQDPQLEALVREVEGLRQQLSEGHLRTELAHLVELVRLLEERIDAREQALRSSIGGSSRWITAAVLGVQALTAVVVVFMGTVWLWRS